MSGLKKVLALDQRIIFLLLFVSLAYPILNPIILPMAVQDYSKMAFEFAESIPPGSVVLFEGGNTAATYPQTGPGMVAQIYHMFTKGVKIVFFSIGAEQQIWTQKAIDEALSKLPPGVQARNGIEWVNLGYIPGGESGVGALANNIRSVVKKDYFGTPIDEIPLMKNINDARAFSAVLWWGGSEGSIPYGIRQIAVPFGIPMSGSCTTNEVPNYSPYISAGQLKGLFGGVRGSAEYEYLLRLPGPALGQAMATNLGGLLWLILVVLGNAFYLILRMRGEK
jgi:hypothetical protein